MHQRIKLDPVSDLLLGGVLALQLFGMQEQKPDDIEAMIETGERRQQGRDAPGVPRSSTGARVDLVAPIGKAD